MRELILSWDEFHRDVRALAARLRRLGRFVGVIGVSRGGLIPATIVARELEIRLVDTVCISLYDHQTKRAGEVLKRLDHDGNGWLVIDDLVDTGATGRLVRDLVPRAHFATVYAKPAGQPVVDTFEVEIAQEVWIHFPWDTGRAFTPPLAQNRDAGT